MHGKNSLAEWIIDTLIVLVGFALAIIAAAEFFLTKEFSNMLIILLGFIIACYGMGRRMKSA